MSDPVRELARAKMNLRLRVLGRDSDGFHALETLFLRLDLADELELRPGADGIELEVEAAPPGAPEAAGAGGDDGAQGTLFPAGRDAAARSASGGSEDDPGPPPSSPEPGSDGAAGPHGDPAEESAGAPVDVDDVPPGPDNLCWRAARRFHEELGEAPDVSIRLVKRVPAAGGLGGGSADAAAVLRGLSRLHGSPLPSETLMRLAGELGSDVPFALLDRPMALGWERGRRLMPLDSPAARPMLLLVPEVRVSTPEAYGWLDDDMGWAEEGDGPEAGPAEAGEGDAGASGREAAALPGADDLSRWDVLLPLRGNDFEAPVFARIPELAWWKEELLGEGAEAALLCGSGSTLCGIFNDERRRDAAADRLRETGELRVVRTRGPV